MSRACPWVALLVLALGFWAFVPPAAHSQKKKTSSAESLLKISPRPKKDPLPPSALPLRFVAHERIALVGNGTAERMSLYGHFEALLHVRYPQLELVVRNFARPADEVALRQRPADYTKLDDPLHAFNPDTFLCFFGFNESYAGPVGVGKFKLDYEKYLDEMAARYPRDDAHSPPRFVLISPLAFEPNTDRFLPDGKTENANLKLYAEAVADVAKKRNLAFIDLYAPTLALFTAPARTKYTYLGVHPNDAGDREVSLRLDQALSGGANPGVEDTARFEKIRAAVVDKAWMHEQDYRMVNGWYVYGGRRTWDTETFPREIVKLRNMVAVRDRYVWDLAQGKQVAAAPDDSKTGELIVPVTRFGDPRQKYSESPEGPRILSPDDFIKSAEVPPGFEVRLFADEKRFPEIAKPVQLNFDNKGRLWVSTMPSYPMWRPGDPKPADKLVILEDTDGDGKADKSTVFYDKLHCPTGFEFWDGGVLVVDQPRVLFLKDTDGDSKADLVIPLLDGWATEDTHHTINAWEYGPGGQLHMLEGIAMSTAVETPWGPIRNFGSAGCYVLDPRTLKIRHFTHPGYNPWCAVFNEWGQGILGDGTTANQQWETPLSGKQYFGRKGLNPVFATENTRPVIGSEFLVTRQFPDDVQGQFLYACVINLNGMPRWTFSDDGAGYKGTRVRHDPNDPKTAFDLLRSPDKHFRPVDPMLGPDGALWFGDWAAATIGHMQYSQRDPNRDHQHGRIYRLVYKNRPLLKPVTQFGKTESELLDQLREYEWRTRYRARAELRARPTETVRKAVASWVARLDAMDASYDRLRCEALWVLQSHHAVDNALLREVVQARTPDARAAAVRVAIEEREYLPDIVDLLKTAATDAHPRVRVEAVRGLSFYPTVAAARAVLAAVQVQPDEYYVRYTGEAALAANVQAWRPLHLKGEFTANAESTKLIEGILAADKRSAEAMPHLQVLLGREQRPAEERNRAMQALADVKGGNLDNGRAVFRRSCLACHKLFEEGADYGPNMDKVGMRLTGLKVIESIIDPNAEVDKKYQTLRIETVKGRVVSGLLVRENKDEVVIFDGKIQQVIPVAEIDDRATLQQSSMPEGLAATMSPVEFLDLVAFLKSLK